MRGIGRLHKVLVASFALLLACGGSTEPDRAIGQSTMLVSVLPDTVFMGSTVDANVLIVQTDDAKPVTGRVVWTSSDPTVATVTSIGQTVARVTPVAPGVAAIRATLGALSGEDAVTVLAARALATISVSILTPSLRGGQSTSALASGIDQYGRSIATGPLVWTSSAPGIAAVSNTGTVTGISGGTATITASAGGRSGSATVIVAPVPARLRIANTLPSTVANRSVVGASVQLVDVNGDPVQERGVFVSVAVGGGGALSGTSFVSTDAAGVATFPNLSIAGSAGARTLTFSSSGLGSASHNFTLTAGPAASIAIAGGNQQTARAGSPVTSPPTVRVTDSDGNLVSGASVTFSVASGGGSVAGGTASTNAAGLASVGSWTLGGIGANSLFASVTGFTNGVTFTATATPIPVPCPSKGSLAINATRTGTLTAASCTFIDSPLTQATRRSPFAGTQIGGVYFFDLYTIEVPSGAVVRFETTDTNALASLVSIAYLEDGTFIASGFGLSSNITLSNPTPSTISYVIVVALESTGALGTYTIRPVRLN